MSTVPERYKRNVGLFGYQGQRKLSQTRTVVVGVSGLGSPLAQQLALLGVGRVGLVEPEEIDDTNRNRFVGARENDPVPGSPKVELVERMIKEINSNVTVSAIPERLESDEAFAEIKSADWVFGCFDNDGPRFILNELCAAYAIPNIDLASEASEDGTFGGRICVASDGNGCLVCLDELDMNEVRRYLTGDEERRAIDAVYGIPREELGQSGPSVAPLNALIAAHTALEFMVSVTSMRAPSRLTKHYGHLPRTTISADEPKRGCYYCKDIWGTRAHADVERYLRIPHLRRRATLARGNIQ